MIIKCLFFSNWTLHPLVISEFATHSSWNTKHVEVTHCFSYLFARKEVGSHWVFQLNNDICEHDDFVYCCHFPEGAQYLQHAVQTDLNYFWFHKDMKYKPYLGFLAILRILTLKLCPQYTAQYSGLNRAGVFQYHGGTHTQYPISNTFLINWECLDPVNVKTYPCICAVKANKV